MVNVFAADPLHATPTITAPLVIDVTVSEVVVLLS
jgi:hypothetical protein